MSSLAEFLDTCSWFNTLTHIQRQQVEEEVYERQYPAGSFVCRTNEIVDAWIGVIEGLAVIQSRSLPKGWLEHGSFAGGDRISLRFIEAKCQSDATGAGEGGTTAQGIS